jgi:hypothetical protein
MPNVMGARRVSEVGGLFVDRKIACEVIELTSRVSTDSRLGFQTRYCGQPARLPGIKPGQNRDNCHTRKQRQLANGYN